MKKYSLPKEFGEKWVEALRSGEYRQGQSILCDRSDNYCCLGVACKIANIVNEDLLDRQWIPIEINVPSEIKGSGADSNLVYELSDLNDRKDKSFPEIADWIVENVEFV